MKQRMYNVFYRLCKNQKISKVLAHLGYSILYSYYFIVRLFLKSSVKHSKDEARKILNDCSPDPQSHQKVQENKFKFSTPTYDLSIIIPAYNVEDFIEKCLSSVLNQQTTYCYEVIVINDGSTDQTLRMIQRFKSDQKLKIINQENKGFSGARNVGIDFCSGKYLMFVDSDDYLCEGAIDALMSQAMLNDASIVQGSYYSFNDDQQQFYYYQPDLKIENPHKNQLIPAYGFPWGKVYKRELFEKIRLPLNYWYEDTILSYFIFPQCTSYISINQCVYAYRLNPKGITFTSKGSNKTLDSYWIIEEMMHIRKELATPYTQQMFHLTLGQLSNHLYRRIHALDEVVIQSAFVLSCELIEQFPNETIVCQTRLSQDLYRAFKTRNYQLWKLCSFVI